MSRNLLCLYAYRGLSVMSPSPSLAHHVCRYHGGGTVHAAAVDSRFLVSKQVDPHTPPHAFLEDGTADYYGIAGRWVGR